MLSPRNKTALAVIALVMATAGVGLFVNQQAQKAAESEPQFAVDERRTLGLMTSLPIFWPLDATLDDIASGAAETPWQRRALEKRFDLVPLDTLSPIPALSSDQPDTDPLNGLDRIAIIQPRGLSPSDNVAIDEWVRAGGELLLVLDPMLTGEYDAPLGDPRRPTDSALVPPIVERWGLRMSFDEDQPAVRPKVFEDGERGRFRLRVSLAGEFAEAGGGSDCTFRAQRILAICTVGEGRVTLLADAMIFEEEFDSDYIDPDLVHPMWGLFMKAFPTG